jgi:hypothetical protein
MHLIFSQYLCRNQDKATGMQQNGFVGIFKVQIIMVFYTRRIKNVYLLDIQMQNFLEVLMIGKQHHVT